MQSGRESTALSSPSKGSRADPLAMVFVLRYKTTMAARKRKPKGGRPRVLHEPAALHLRLERADYKALSRLAANRDITPSALVREWIAQGLRRAVRRPKEKA